MPEKKPYHQKVAEEVIKQLKEGTAPWLKPWKPGHTPGRPVNALTNKPYRGWNSVYLAMAQPNGDPRWCTFKQAKELGANVKKGSRSTVVQYWKTFDKQLVKDEKGKPLLDEKGEKKYMTVALERPRVFHANVFHASQIDGLPPLEIKPEKTEWERHEEAEKLLKASGASINHSQSDRAFYRPSTDSIHMPEREQFETPDNYYATALHELGHWTGHSSRLDRDMVHPFGSEGYAKEELRAEIASYMLGTELGIGHDPGQHVAYVGSWVKALEDDPNEIFRASRDAEKITDFVKGLAQEQSLEQSQQQASPEVTLPSRDETNMQIANQLEPASEKTWLKVPFHEKDQAKKRGARWDKSVKSWYAPQGVNLQPLSSWLPEKQALQQERPTDPVEEFTEALKSAGLKIDGLAEMDGKMHRVSVEGGQSGRKDGAYKGFLDGHPAGFIQNFKTGYKSNWKATGQRLDPAEVAKIEAEAQAKQQVRERERQAEYEKKSEQVSKEFDSLPWATTAHPYIEKKGLNLAFGAKEDQKGNLVIPLKDKDRKIWNIQRIGQNGFKGYEKGAKVEGNYFVIGGMERMKKEPKDKPLLISTGFATSASIHMSMMAQSVVATFQDSNLKAVAKEMQTLFPERPIAILGDDDKHNIEKGLANSGREKAEEAAASVGGVAIFPRFTARETGKEHTDFSDLHRTAGVKTVKRQIEEGLSKLKKRSNYQEVDKVQSIDKEKVKSIEKPRKNRSVGMRRSSRALSL